MYYLLYKWNPSKEKQCLYGQLLSYPICYIIDWVVWYPLQGAGKQTNPHPLDLPIRGKIPVVSGVSNVYHTTRLCERVSSTKLLLASLSTRVSSTIYIVKISLKIVKGSSYNFLGICMFYNQCLDSWNSLLLLMRSLQLHLTGRKIRETHHSSCHHFSCSSRRVTLTWRTPTATCWALGTVVSMTPTSGSTCTAKTSTNASLTWASSPRMRKSVSFQPFTMSPFDSFYELYHNVWCDWRSFGALG